MRERVVLVTGGTGFLGQAVVRHFLEAGARVVVPWVAQAEAERLREQTAEGARLTLIEASVTDPAGADAIVAACREAGVLQVAVLLVGGFAMQPIHETERSTWDRMWTLNATSVFQVAHHVLPLLRETGGGRVITVAAEPALDRGAPGMAAYAATKSAVVSFTQSMAREGAEYGVTANAVAPRIIDTPANREAMPDADTSTWLAPEAIAQVIGFLAGPEAGIVTGNVLTLSLG
ncbi:MAG: SDR family oxidoreductase [Gemmatimonadales bacterium]|nr:MAG: SDR family oxidoreductase [Gemmatimonadales bacterium]